MSRLDLTEGRIRAWVRGELRALQARLAYWAPSSVSTSDGKLDSVAGRTSNDAEPSDLPAPRVQHAGFRSRPIAGTDQRVSVAVEGGSTTLISVAEDDGQGDNVPLASGEACVYSPTKPTCRAYFDKDGVLHIDGADSNTDVIVNGGNKAVVRVGDTCEIVSLAGGGALATWMNQVEGFINGLSGGTVAPLSSSIVASPGIKTKSGASHFKA